MKKNKLSMKKIKDNESNVYKKAYRKANEKKRRDKMKASFATLRDVLPSCQNKDKVSCSQILNEAVVNFQMMKRKNMQYENDIDDLKKHIKDLEDKIGSLEIAMLFGNDMAVGDWGLSFES